MSSDAHLYQWCVAIIVGYFVLWWVTSIEPESRRKKLQKGLRAHYRKLMQRVATVRAAPDEEGLAVARLGWSEELTETATWIDDNMGMEAALKFRDASGVSYGHSWAGDHSPEARRERDDVLNTNTYRLEALEQMMASDAWDGKGLSRWERVKERIKKWKTRMIGSTAS